ncbi:DinB family protein [Actinocorallia aurea]
MTDLDEQGRPLPPLDGDEFATLTGFLDYQRATFAGKCRGLDDAGLRATVGVSSMTLGGLLKHLAFVEDTWVTHRVLGAPRPAPWDAVDWRADPDWDWRTAADDDPAALYALWHTAVARSRAALAAALERSDLSTPSALPRLDGTSPSVRWILCHLIEEYARHNGHADLLRESVDGSTGE